MKTIHRSSPMYAPKPKAQETTGTWKSRNCMRMSDVPANPLWEIRIILTKTTIAGTGHNWKATQRLLGVPCPNHPWELQFFGDAHFFWIEQVHARHWVPMSANKPVSHQIFFATPFFFHTFFWIEEVPPPLGANVWCPMGVTPNFC